ncbi:hypothetical protein LUZ60_008979 [Juncus effusus]|nr:hypothetical protein LUZ60_008979 [Juncus effusus]
MVKEGEKMVYGHKISTVVPASVTGEINHDLTNMDLVMKLHYLRGVYYFQKSEVLDSISIFNFKQPMFPWLDLIYPVAGRVRRTDKPGGRPYVKCNDSGVRIVEAKCDVSLDDWLKDKKLMSRSKRLVSDKVLGPELYFSPLAYIQFTEFKCGGKAIGFSWAHIMGGPLTAVNWFNIWSQILNNPKLFVKEKSPPKFGKDPTPEKILSGEIPNSVKEIESVGDNWVPPNSSAMATYSFEISENKIKELSMNSVQVGDFELISAFVWQTIAKIRGNKELNKITICKSNSSKSIKYNLTNEDISITSVKTDSSPSKLDLHDLALLIAKEATDETKLIQESVQGENQYKDLVVYGANLTFVDMLQVDLYGFDFKGEKPVSIEYAIDGVGEEGAVLIMQGNEKKKKLAVLILPENELRDVVEVLESSCKCF